jgi:pimeloyl-ACP methyl ester carboxylesterase
MKKIVNFTLAKSLGLYINMLSYVYPEKSIALAYQLFSQPRKGKLKSEQLPKILQSAILNSYPYKNQTIQTYTWKGNNDIVFLIHGWESNGSRWKKLLKHLIKSGKTIIAIDGPAHGLSSGKEFNVPTYVEYIDFIAQKFPPKVIIGHSLGGNASVYYQSKYQHTVEKMILLGSPSDLKVIFKNYKNLLSLNNKVFNLLKKKMHQKFNIHVDEYSAANFLKETTISGLIIHDVIDKVVLIDEAKKMAATWKHAKLIETKGLGHSLHDDNLYQTIVEFIQ